MFALDTNTVSYYFRGDEVVRGRLQALSPAQVAVPSVVAYELRYGLLRMPAAAREPRMQALALFLEPVALLPFDAQAAEHAARVRAQLEAAGTPIGPHDVLIAATAMAHGATLITRNVGEFRRVPGLLVETWHAG